MVLVKVSRNFRLKPSKFVALELAPHKASIMPMRNYTGQLAYSLMWSIIVMHVYSLLAMYWFFTHNVVVSNVCAPLDSTGWCSCVAFPPFFVTTPFRNNKGFEIGKQLKTIAPILFLDQYPSSKVDTEEVEVGWVNDMVVSSNVYPWDEGLSALMEKVSSLILFKSIVLNSVRNDSIGDWLEKVDADELSSSWMFNIVIPLSGRGNGRISWICFTWRVQGWRIVIRNLRGRDHIVGCACGLRC